MSINFKQSALKLALFSGLTFVSVTSVLAGTVGGSVTPINTVAQTDIDNITIGSSTAGAANGQTDTVIVTGQIDNNNEFGWELKVVSSNVGKLIRGDGGPGNEILYTNIEFAKTGGTLGTGLTSPNGTKDIASGTATDSGAAQAGTTSFFTGSAVGAKSTGTTSTVALAYALQISWDSDLALLAGSYADTITLTLTNDV